MKDIILYMYILHSCVHMYVCLDWCGAGTGYLWNGKFRGTLRTTYVYDSTVYVYYIHVHLGSNINTNTYIHINVVQVCTHRGT